MNFKIKKRFRLILTAVSLIFLHGLALGAVGDITISAPASDPDQGVSFTSEVTVDVGTHVLGAYSIAFLFNQDVLQITGIQGGTTSEFSAIPTYGSIATANTTGRINIAAFNSATNSPTGLISIFRITFSVIGSPGSSSNLSMNVTDLADPDFNPISHNVIGSSVTVKNESGKTVPTVATTTVSSIGQTSAVSGGNVTADGGDSVTSRGVCWSMTSNPTKANNHTTDGTGTGIFASSLTGLAASATYHVRAYATNGVGTAYGSDKSFTTSTTAKYPPMATTHSVGDLTSTSAVLNGTVNPNGLSTDYYFEYGPTIFYEYKTATMNAGSGTADVQVAIPISGLPSNETWHYRLIADNSDGVAFGNDMVFTTYPIPDIKVNGEDGPLTITTDTPFSVTVTLAVGDKAGQDADWWIAAYSPVYGWFSYVLPGGWTTDLHLSFQYPLVNIPETVELLQGTLPPGQYFFFFVIDDNADGELDATWLDYVEVNVQ